MKLTPETSYRVLKAASLTGWEVISQGGGAYHERGTGRKLAVGDVIVFSGYAYSGGSDGITVPHFKVADGTYRGQLSTTSWGVVRPGALEEVVPPTPPATPPAKAEKKPRKRAGKKCGKCGATKGNCPECGKAFDHGTAAACDVPACQRVNAPVDCECGLVVSAKLDGVLSLDGDLIRWRRPSRSRPGKVEDEDGIDGPFVRGMDRADRPVKPKRKTKAKAPACTEHQPVPYTSGGALGHGWECARCGTLLQVG